MPLQSDADSHLREELARIGFRPEMIVDQGSSYLVEGDIEIDKRALKGGGAPAGRTGDLRRAPDGPRFQYIGDRTVSYRGFQERTLHVYITTLIRNQQPEWARAVREAMTHWNQLGGFGLTFAETTSESSSEIVVTSYTHDVDVVAKSAWPAGTSAGPGPWIKINLGYRRGAGAGGQPVYASKVFHMVHEMGHTLGFRHANWQVVGESAGDSVGAHLIEHTSSIDALSVMNAGASTRAWSGFSEGDRIAARVAYPGAVGAAGTIDGGYPRLSWKHEAGAYQYRIFRESGWFPFTAIYDVATTTDTAHADSQIPATEARACQIGEFPTHAYFVVAYFPEGTVTRRVNNVCVY